MLNKKEIKELAEKIRKSDQWALEDCAALCEAADMEEEWESADGENFEAVVFNAAEKLGVEIA